MPTIKKYEHGEFSWVDLATTDSDAAKKFYGSLLGWTFEDMPAGPSMVYSMAKLGGETAAALYTMGPDMKGAPPFWLSYVTVDDLEAVTRKAKDAGGTIDKEPFDVMDVGRMAVLQDPTGAHFAFWQPKRHIGATVKNEPGALTYNELYTTNPDVAGKFYVQTLGWKTKSMDMGPMGTYTLFGREGSEANVGGMMQMPPNMKGVPSNWLVYFLVSDCDASTKKVTELGGKTLMPPTQIPNIGRFSVNQDPQGAVFALFKMEH